MCMKPTYAIAIAEVNRCLEGLRFRYLPSMMSWLIFRNCFCALDHMEEVVKFHIQLLLSEQLSAWV